SVRPSTVPRMTASGSDNSAAGPAGIGNCGSGRLLANATVPVSRRPNATEKQELRTRLGFNFQGGAQIYLPEPFGSASLARRMSSLIDLTTQLASGRELTADEVEAAALALMTMDDSDEVKANFLAGLAEKGETASEVASFARIFRARAVAPGGQAWASRAIDIVGTGGDHAGGFNSSSLVVLVLASAGAVVMKHGNRGVTSKCGSADLLAGL